MKQAMAFSLLLHAGLLATLVLFSALQLSFTKRGYPTPCRVRLLTLPQKATPKTAPATPRRAPSATAAPAAAATPAGLKIVADNTGVPSYYLGLIISKIGQYWRNPYTRGPLTLACLVRFTIDQTGGVGGAAVESSSGNVVFDQAALRAVYEARRFPPLPEDLGPGTLTVHFEFEYAPEK
jgi:TonB family protein